MPEDRVLDGAALKALAHPIRFQIVERLMEQGPATASSLARELGENSGSTSYHLRQLAAQDLIEEATELGSRRDRYWRVMPGGWTLEGFELLLREDTREDAWTYLDEITRTRLDAVRRWHREAPRWGDEWVGRSLEMTGRFRLTPDELGALRDELVAVVDRYRDLQTDRRDVPVSGDEPYVPVRIQLDAWPIGDPPATASAADVEDPDEE
ncbi:ArsR/SmtB family transcription factor [Egicoccus halophilus]|nr:helix-turn-helix domain-containing protein [Egicoccus halophilus]